MYVDVSAHRIHVSEAIDPRLKAAKPKNSCRNPVAPRVVAQYLGSANFACEATAAKYCAARRSRSYQGPNFVQSSGRLLAPIFLTGSVEGRRDGVFHYSYAILVNGQPFR
jgi:hypothetical protein